MKSPSEREKKEEIWLGTVARAPIGYTIRNDKGRQVTTQRRHQKQLKYLLPSNWCGWTGLRDPNRPTICKSFVIKRKPACMKS